MGATDMRDGIQTLTEREKDTLRLLLAGHDAKSIARRLDLSVHTINERLRDARRKLGVASSREAARLLHEAERATPEDLGDKPLGVTGAAAGVLPTGAADRGRNGPSRIAWLSGGMLIMSLIISALALVAITHSGTVPAGDAAGGSAATSADPARAASQVAAREWLALVDEGRWPASWRAAAAMFRAQVTMPQWDAMIAPVRAPLGRVSARTFQTVTATTSLPGTPAGAYEVIQFRTDFANRPGATETVTLVREGTAWKVTGYFIR